MSLLRAKIQSVKYDEIYTPKYAVEPIIPFIPKGAKILLPFDTTESNFYQILTFMGYDVHQSSLREGKDFFTYEKGDVKDYDLILSNPPYSIKDDVLSKLYELGKPFAMLMPITTLEGVARHKMFKENGIQVLVLDKRVDFLDQKQNNYFNTSYFCWQFLPNDLMFAEVNKVRLKRKGGKYE